MDRLDHGMLFGHGKKSRESGLDQGKLVSSMR